MVKKIGLFVLFGLFLCVALGMEMNREEHSAQAPTPAPSPALAAPPEPPPPLLVTAVTEAHPEAHAELHRRIEQAKRMLTNAPLPSNTIGGDNAVLAVWDPSTRGPVRLVTLLGGTCRTQGCNVSVLVRNGVGSRYRVNAPQNHIVIALKTNVHDPVRKGSTTQVVYVPYSPDLQTTENVAAGREYLTDLVTRSAQTMNSLDVRSKVNPDKRPTDIVPARILMTLLVVEHEDPDDFDRDGVEATVGKVLTVLATNRDDAYRYAVSYADARGLAQFIKTTYEATRTRYPRANLSSSFVEGMTDHVTAVRAQYCLADWSITRLPPPFKEQLLRAGNEEELGAYLAAAYNGGEELASRVLAANPRHWECAGNGLFTQTVKYVQIFRATYKYLGQ